MTAQKGNFQRSLLARELRELLPVSVPIQDSILSNKEAASFLNGPTPIRYTENGNVYWLRTELEGFLARRQLQAETNALRSVQQRSLITDLVPY